VRRICSWCQKDLGVKEPLDDPTITSGICRECLGELVTPEMKGYLVVSRPFAHLYSDASELLRSRPEIRVIVDRRYGDRRQARLPVVKERRSADRRRKGIVISVEGLGILAPADLKPA